MQSFLTLTLLTLAIPGIVVGLGTALFEWAVPTTRQGIVGVALGARGDVTRIPRHALDCTRSDPAALAETCIITIDGAALRIDVEYKDGVRFGRCAASHGPTTTSCWPVWFALSGGPRLYASVPAVRPGQPHETTQWLGSGRVETLQAPHLELSEATLQALRREYPLTNSYEPDWMRLFMVASGTAALITAALVLLPGIRRSAGRPAFRLRGTPIPCLVVAAGCGGASFCLAYVGLIFQAMRAGLVD